MGQGCGGVASALDLIQAAELIGPQAQPWSITIFYANHMTALISQLSTHRWIVHESGGTLRQDTPPTEVVRNAQPTPPQFGPTRCSADVLSCLFSPSALKMPPPPMNRKDHT